MEPSQKQEEETPGFFHRVKNMFHHEKEEKPTYSRRLLDGKIERYLDEHFDAYVDEYGLITSLDLTVYEERVDAMEPRIALLKDFMGSADAELADMERRVANIKKAKKSSKKKK